MDVASVWKHLRLIVLSLAVAVAAVGAPPATPLSLSSTSVVLAGDDEDDDEDDDDEEEDDEEAGRVVNGQVIGIYTPSGGWSKAPNTSFDESTPPGMVALRIGQTGNQIVSAVLWNPNLLTEWGVHLGDHISLDGEFQGGTFYGTDIEVEDRCC